MVRVLAQQGWGGGEGIGERGIGNRNRGFQGEEVGRIVGFGGERCGWVTCGVGIAVGEIGNRNRGFQGEEVGRDCFNSGVRVVGG